MSPDAATQWARVGIRLAARSRIRVSRDGGRSYPRRYERLITPKPPPQPAAVLIYDTQGCAPVFVVDLDASKAPEGGLASDFAALSTLLERAGLRWFSDHSPNGGRHVYIPVAEPIPFPDAREAAELLGRRLPSVDPSPMRSIASGCIRPPGALHRTGGRQVLDGALELAEDILGRPNALSGWANFLDELRRRTGPVVVMPNSDAPDPGPDARLSPLPGHDGPSEDFQRIARTGEYDRARYRSPSEARQAVLWAAAASGWSLTDVARRVQDGTWPGMASFYARYRPTQRHTAMARDWRRAQAFEKNRRRAAGKESVRVRTTSPHKTQRGAVGGTAAMSNRFVREWLHAVELLHGPGSDLGTRAVLLALAEAAVLKETLTVEHGTRSLAIGTGLDHSTVGRILRRLAAAPADRALIQKVAEARGIYADAYELRIPPLLRPACAQRPWRRGRIFGIRPAFRELGLVAAYVYAALEQRGGEPVDGRQLAEDAHVGVTATYDALNVLAAHGLAERTPGGWMLGDGALNQLAEAWGIVDVIRAQLARYRAERAAWRDWLVARGLLDSRYVLDEIGPAPPPPKPISEPDEFEGLLTMLERELGATVLTAS